jgi:hypothetical protein
MRTNNTRRRGGARAGLLAILMPACSRVLWSDNG